MSFQYGTVTLYYSIYIKGYVEQENYLKFVGSFRETGNIQV